MCVCVLPAIRLAGEPEELSNGNHCTGWPAGRRRAQVAGRMWLHSCGVDVTVRLGLEDVPCGGLDFSDVGQAQRWDRGLPRLWRAVKYVRRRPET